MRLDPEERVLNSNKPRTRCRIYLAGPMRGIPYFNFPLFGKWTAALRANGHEVFSPAEKDIERYGPSFAMDHPTGDEKEAVKRYHFDLRMVMLHDLSWICQQADEVALLPGWEKSRGARAEKAVAEAIGLNVLYLHEPNPVGDHCLPFTDQPLGHATRKFDTGATRDTDVNKPDYEGYISPLVIEAFGRYMTRHRKLPDGSLRASDNWQKGIPQDVYMKSAWRHFVDWWIAHRGYKIKESLEEALCGVLFNVMGYLHEHLKIK